MKARQLGTLEQKVMGIVWEKKRSTVREVLSGLPTRKKVAYTTVATILQRLHDKRLVIKRRENTIYIYSPRLSRQDYTKGVARSFVQKFFDSFGDEAVASFAESVGVLPKRKREYFLKLLKK